MTNEQAKQEAIKNETNKPLKRGVTVKFDIQADKLNNEMLRLIVEREIKAIAPTLITNVKVDIIYTNQ